MIRILFLILCLFVFGCATYNLDDIAIKENSQIDIPKIDYRKNFRRGLYSFKGDNIYITDIVRYLKNEVCVVYASELRDETFSLDVNSVSLAELMKMVAVSMDVSVRNMGRLWVFSKNIVRNNSGNTLNSTSSASTLSDNVEYTYFFEIVGYSDNEVIQNLSMFQVKKISNGLYCFRGSLNDAISLDEILVEMLLHQPVQYFFTVYFISEDFLRDFNFNFNSKMTFELKKYIGDTVKDSNWSLLIDILGDNNLDMSNKDTVKKISGVVREGYDFVFNLGDEVPIPKRAVSDSGTVSDVGYDYQRIGLNLKLSCEGKSRGVLTVDLENTDVSGYVGSYPIKHGSRVSTQLVVSDSDKSYIGSCFMVSTEKGVLGYRKKSTKYHVLVQCDLIGLGQRVSIKDINNIIMQ